MSISGFKNIHINHFINSVWVKSEKTSPILNGNKRILFLLYYLKNFKYLIKYKNLIKKIILFISKNGLLLTFRKIFELVKKL